MMNVEGNAEEIKNEELKMKNEEVDYLDGMKIKGSLLLFFFAALAAPVFAQNKDQALYKQIQHMDSVMFDAFNTHNLAVLRSVFAENLEFFHDKGGLTNYAVSMENFQAVFRNNPDLKRELVPGTLEVYPLPGYGAVEMGEHRFSHKENGKELVAVFKFTHIWQLTNNEWKVTRVISVGH